MAMARKSRIDAPGALSQIIVRRIERREKWNMRDGLAIMLYLLKKS